MKKLILTILAAFCMLGFSACGSSAPVETSSQTEAVQQETQAQVTEAEQPGEDKAAPGQTEKQQQGHDSCVLLRNRHNKGRGGAYRKCHEC